MRADAVCVGDVLTHVHANDTSSSAVVVAVDSAEDFGVVAPLIASGQIVVDGILASCHADTFGLYSNTMSHMALQPLIVLHKLAPWLVEGSASPGALHWYPATMIQLHYTLQKALISLRKTGWYASCALRYLITSAARLSGIMT